MNENIKDPEILEGVLAEFSKLAAIPRKSGHEERIGMFLFNYLKAYNLKVERDKVGNIIADFPASAGYENAPQTILQAHMDMVCVARDGYEFDPLTDPIKLVRTEKFLSAEGTSLGADDGMGIAEIIYIVKNFAQGKFEKIPHGKLRLIFTVAEETGMDGAIEIDKKYFSDARCLINCDSEHFDELVVGSAGGVHIDFKRKVKFEEPDKKLKTAMHIKISGLKGGHSGEDIAKGRVNAIKAMFHFFRVIDRESKFQLADFSGGKAYNSIPDVAEAVIVTDMKPEAVSECGDLVRKRIFKLFGKCEPDARVDCKLAERPERVLSADDFEKFSGLVMTMHSGVYAMSHTIPGLVESSSNLGAAKITDDSIILNLLSRSAVYERLGDFIASDEYIAKFTGFEMKAGMPSPAWDFNPDGKLAKIMAEVFEEQNGRPMNVKTIHAGLECSYFLSKNISLDAVSTGTTNENIHSPNERLHLDTVAPHVMLLVETLKRIAEN